MTPSRRDLVVWARVAAQEADPHSFAFFSAHVSFWNTLDVFGCVSFQAALCLIQWHLHRARRNAYLGSTGSAPTLICLLFTHAFLETLEAAES